jgi:hypothetical protein
MEGMMIIVGNMFTDIDGWACILWVILLALTVGVFLSKRPSGFRTLAGVSIVPGICVFMAFYALIRTDDAWCFGWAVVAMVICVPITLFSLARLTAEYVGEVLNEKKAPGQRTSEPSEESPE